MTVTNAPMTSRTIYAARGGERLTPDVLWQLPRVGAPVPAPDGRYVAVPVTTYDQEGNDACSRIWRVDVESGAARPLTSTEVHSSQPAFAPTGEDLAFVRKPIGKQTPKENELPVAAQVYILPLDGGEPERVTDMPLGCFDPQWLPDGSGIVFGAHLLKEHLTPEATREESLRRDRPQTVHVTEERVYRFWDQWLTDGKVPHLFVLDLTTRAVRDITPDSTLWFGWMDTSDQFDIAPDGSEVLFNGLSCTGLDGRPRNDVYRVPMQGGTPEILTADNPSSSFGAKYAPDGKSFVYGMQHDDEFYADRVRLMRRDCASGEELPVLTAWAHSPGGWRFDAKSDLYFNAEVDARVQIFRLAAAEQDDKHEPQPLTEGGSCSSVRPASDGTLHFMKQTISQPPEAAACPAAGGETSYTTRFTQDVLLKVALAEVRDVRFTGAADAEIQMFVILPEGHDEASPLPLVHLVHGGPHGVFGDLWQWRWNAQTFTAQGYAVAMVNFHGSTSWGQEFAQCIQGSWGDRPYVDIMKATDALIDAGIADPERMAVAGASYGGYLVSWIASNTDRFRCAVNHAGVYDMKLKYAADFTFGLQRVQGSTPWEDDAPIDAHDPARTVKGLNTPMLVSHGEKDYRVVVNHALECYGLLKAKGVPARLAAILGPYL